MLRNLLFTLTIFIFLYSGDTIAKTALHFGPAPAW